jgi:hypothetical protein
MLLHDGRIEALGEPDEITDLYLKLNMDAFARSATSRGEFLSRTAAAIADPAARVADMAVTDTEGRRRDAFGPREAFEVRATAELEREVEALRLYLAIDNARGQSVFVATEDDELGLSLASCGHERGPLQITATLENRLAGGRYLVRCGLLSRGADGSLGMAGPGRTLRLDVAGESHGGTVLLDHAVTVELGARPGSLLS